MAVAEQTGMYCRASGSLHLVHEIDEYCLIEEFAQDCIEAGIEVKILTADDTVGAAPCVVRDGLLGSLWSPYELNVDPRQAIPMIVEYLKTSFGVEFLFGVNIVAVHGNSVFGHDVEIDFEHAYVCTGQDFEVMVPELKRQPELQRVKLQMLRTSSPSSEWSLGPALCAGLTLLHYDAFKNLDSIGPLRARIENTRAEYVRNGIHVLVSQGADGQLILGDSHEYGPSPDPFIRTRVNELILDEIRRVMYMPNVRIDETWIGVYARNSGASEYVERVTEAITIVNGLGGAGMTLSFGLAEEVVGGTYRAE
jgi:FAD dependent oxidoreductase TIGR03364